MKLGAAIVSIINLVSAARLAAEQGQDKEVNKAQ